MPVKQLQPAGNTSNAEDICLIARFLEGNESAFEKLFRKYQNPLFAVCLRFLGNRAEAEDVLQEAFLSIYSSLSGFKGQSTFLTWAYQVTVRKCFARSRTLKKRQTLHLEIVRDQLHVDPIDVENLHIRQALQLLPDQYHIVLILMYYQQMSYEEIAEVLGCNIGQIKMRMHRARNSLREILERIERGDTL